MVRNVLCRLKNRYDDLFCWGANNISLKGVYYVIFKIHGSWYFGGIFGGQDCSASWSLIWRVKYAITNKT